MNFINQKKKQAKGAKFDANMGQEVQGKKCSKTFLNLPSPSDRGQISIKLEAKYNESQQMFCRKKMPLLTGLEVSSLACKCVFYRREHNERGEGPHGTEYRNETYQRIERTVQMEKIGSFVELSCLLPKLGSLKC